jgi:hypothetical protein
MGLVKETPSERSKRSKSDSFSVPFGPFVLAFWTKTNCCLFAPVHPTAYLIFLKVEKKLKIF